MNIKKIKHLFFLLCFLSVVNIGLLSAQVTPFPDSYDQTKISPWGHTSKGTSWDTSPLLPFIYNGVAMRIMPPNGVTFNSTSKTWNFGSGEKYPIILFFHGAGEKGTDNNNQLTHGGQVHRDAVLSGKFPGFLLYPQNAYITDMKMLLDQMVAEGYPVDLTRVYVHGLSLGANWTWEFALAYPETVAAIFPMSGVTGSDLTSLIYTPVRLAQGGLDTNPKPGWAFDRVDYFKGIGGQIELFYLPEYGHGTWNAMYSRTDFFSWFLNNSITTIYAKSNYSEVCPQVAVDVTLGINPGLQAYEWRKNNVLMAGETQHKVRVFEYGSYTVRTKIRGEWTAWSQPKVVGERLPTATPPINTLGLQSNVLPDPNGKTNVSLTLPDGYETYEWFKNDVSFSSSQTILATQGVYTALVQERYSCSSFKSAPYNVIVNSGVNVPALPNGLVVSAVSKTELDLVWTDNATNETGFEIWRRREEETIFNLVTVLPANATSYHDLGLLAGTTYKYSLRAINGNGASVLTAEVGKSTLDDFIIPTSPRNLVVTNTTLTTVSLSWEQSTDDVGIKKYNIYQDGVKIMSVNTLGETSITVYNLVSNKLFGFNVTSVDFSGNESPKSNRVIAGTVLSGLQYKYYEGSWNALPNFTNLTPVKVGRTPNIDISLSQVSDYFAFYWEGFIKIPIAGSYTFETKSDDGSKLYIGGYSENNLVVNNDGLHGSVYAAGTRVFNQAGTYPIVVTYFEKTGGNDMLVFWKNTAHGVGSRQIIPDEAFSNAITLPLESIYAPTNLQATGTSHSTIDLTWTDNNLNEVGYQVFRSIDNANYESVGLVGANVTSFKDTGLTAQKLYYYKVIALAAYVESPASSVQTSTLSFNPPTNFTAVANSISTIQLSWSGLGVDGFEISRSLTVNGVYSIIANLTGSQLSFVNTGLTAHTQYYYAIRANSGGQYSSIVKVSGTTLNSIPTITSTFSNYLIDIDQNLSLPLKGNDSDGDVLAFSSNNLPSFVSIVPVNANSATIVIQPNGAHIGVYNNIAVVVQDGFGGVSNSVLFNLEIYKNQSPDIERLDNFSYTEVEGVLHAEIRTNQTTVLSYLFSDPEGDQLMSSGIQSIPNFASYNHINSNDGAIVFNPAINNVGSYSIEVYVVDAIGKRGSLNFILDVVAFDPNHDPVVDYESVFVNFSNSSLTLASPWNNFNLAPVLGSKLGHLKNDEAVDTGFEIELLNSWYGAGQNGATTGNNTGYFPDNVISTQILSSTDNRNIKLSGLDVNKVFDLVLFASHGSKKAIETRVTRYTVGDQSNNLIVNNNTSKVVVLKALKADTNGEMLLTVSKKSGDWSYLNALELRYYDEPIAPFEPTQLQASALSHGSIHLTWQDNSSNENGFEVYRSTMSNGPWVNIYTSSENENSYTDTGLEDNTLYYYQVRSFNNIGFSEYSEKVQEATFVYSFYQTVLVNFTTKSEKKASAPWNNMFGNPIAGFFIEDLQTTLGVPTDLKVELLNKWDGGDVWGGTTGNNSGVYPDDVMETYFVDNPDETNQIIISGCNPNKIYELSLFSSKRWAGNTITQFEINGVTTQLNVDGNTSKVAVTRKVSADVNDQIVINLSKGSSGPIFINALELRFYDEPIIPLKPTDVKLATVSSESLKLTWIDNSTNEDGFDIYKSLSQGGAWVKIATVASNIEMFVDESLDDDTKYFYYVTAFNNEGNSNSDIVFGTTFLFKYYESVLINFSEWTPAAAPWNTMTGKPNAGLKLTNILTSNGQETDVELELLNSWLGSDGNGTTTGNNSGQFPDEVMSTSIVDDSESARQILFTGLDPNKLYELILFSSRSWVSNVTTKFEVNGFTTSILVDNNNERFGLLENLSSNASGEILLKVSKSVGNNLMFFNALELRSFFEPEISFPPINLVSEVISSDKISLSWKDKSTNEVGFEVYRSSTIDGPWSKIAEVGENAGQFLDINLTQNTTYFYKIRSYNGNGESEFTGIVSGKTYEYFEIESILVNFSGWDRAASPWNNLVQGIPQAGFGLDNMLNTQGLRTQVGIELLNAWQGSDGNGYSSVDNTGIYPNEVMASSFTDNSVADRQILLKGLDNSKLVDLVFFSSRKWIGATQIEILVNGREVSIVTGDNQSTVAAIEALSPNANGELLIEVGMSAGSYSRFLNSMEVHYYEEPVIPFAPNNISSTAYSDKTINLTWKDKSTNETGFEIYRSITGLDNWVLISTVGSNIEVYLDNGLSQASTYYYRIRSFNTDGMSDFSTIAHSTTYAKIDIESISVNFSGWTTMTSPWNNFVSGTPTQGNQVLDMINDRGLSTTVDIKLLNNWVGSDGNGASTGNNSGVMPDLVMESSFKDDSNVDNQLLISGLDQTKVYDFTFFASRKWSSDAISKFTIGTATVSLSAYDNTSNVVKIEGVKANVSGEITILVSKGAGSTVKFLNGLIIQYKDEPELPNAPESLVANAVDAAQISLTWLDKSSNESGFKIYSSTVGANGPWSLLTTLGSNVQSFQVGGLVQNKVYYFKVGAYNDKGENASNISYQSTYLYRTLINFNQGSAQGAPWNNFNSLPDKGNKLNNLLNTSGNPTGINVEMGSGWTNEYPGGFVDPNVPGVYPNNVMLTFFYVLAPEVGSFKLTGLNYTHSYDLSFLANWFDPSTSTFEHVGGASVSVNSYRNISNLVKLYDLRPNENGEIEILVHGSPAAVLNAMEINVSGGYAPSARLAQGTENVIAREFELNVFPNPAADYLKIDFNNGDGLDVDSNYQLINLEGKIVSYGNIDTTRTNHIEFRDIQNGMYFLRVYTADKVFLKKVIVSK